MARASRSSTPSDEVPALSTPYARLLFHNLRENTSFVDQYRGRQRETYELIVRQPARARSASRVSFSEQPSVRTIETEKSLSPSSGENEQIDDDQVEAEARPEPEWRSTLPRNFGRRTSIDSLTQRRAGEGRSASRRPNNDGIDTTDTVNVTPTREPLRDITREVLSREAAARLQATRQRSPIVRQTNDTQTGSPSAGQAPPNRTLTLDQSNSASNESPIQGLSGRSARQNFTISSSPLSSNPLTPSSTGARLGSPELPFSNTFYPDSDKIATEEATGAQAEVQQRNNSHSELADLEHHAQDRALGESIETSETNNISGESLVQHHADILARDPSNPSGRRQSRCVVPDSQSSDDDSVTDDSDAENQDPDDTVIVSPERRNPSVPAAITARKRPFIFEDPEPENEEEALRELLSQRPRRHSQQIQRQKAIKKILSEEDDQPRKRRLSDYGNVAALHPNVTQRRKPKRVFAGGSLYEQFQAAMAAGRKEAFPTPPPSRSAADSVLSSRRSVPGSSGPGPRKKSQSSLRNEWRPPTPKSLYQTQDASPNPTGVTTNLIDPNRENHDVANEGRENATTHRDCGIGNSQMEHGEASIERQTSSNLSRNQENEPARMPGTFEDMNMSAAQEIAGRLRLARVTTPVRDTHQIAQNAHDMPNNAPNLLRRASLKRTFQESTRNTRSTSQRSEASTSQPASTQAPSRLTQVESTNVNQGQETIPRPSTAAQQTPRSRSQLTLPSEARRRPRQTPRPPGSGPSAPQSAPSAIPRMRSTNYGPLQTPQVINPHGGIEVHTRWPSTARHGPPNPMSIDPSQFRQDPHFSLNLSRPRTRSRAPPPDGPPSPSPARSRAVTLRDWQPSNIDLSGLSDEERKAYAMRQMERIARFTGLEVRYWDFDSSNEATQGRSATPNPTGHDGDASIEDNDVDEDHSGDGSEETQGRDESPSRRAVPKRIRLSLRRDKEDTDT